MSAWYILNAMGFYQVCPGKPVYSIGRPLFNEATVHLKDGKSFKVIAHNNSRDNKYVRSIVLNGNKIGDSILHASGYSGRRYAGADYGQ